MLLFPHCFLSGSFLLKFFWCHQWFFLSYYFFLSIYGKKSWTYTTKDIYQPCTMPEKYFCKFFVVQFSVTIFITQLNHTKSNKQKTENISYRKNCLNLFHWKLAWGCHHFELFLVDEPIFISIKNSKSQICFLLPIIITVCVNIFKIFV